MAEARRSTGAKSDPTFSSLLQSTSGKRREKIQFKTENTYFEQRDRKKKNEFTTHTSLEPEYTVLEPECPLDAQGERHGAAGASSRGGSGGARRARRSRAAGGAGVRSTSAPRLSTRYEWCPVENIAFFLRFVVPLHPLRPRRACVGGAAARAGAWARWAAAHTRASLPSACKQQKTAVIMMMIIIIG